MEEVACLEDKIEGIVVDVGPKAVKIRYMEHGLIAYDREKFTTLPKPGDKFTMKIAGYFTPAEVAKKQEKEEKKAASGGGRKFAKIPLNDFIEKVKAAILVHEDYEPYGNDEGPEDPMEAGLGVLSSLTSTVTKDLSKVNFTAENTYIDFAEDSRLLGFHQWENGLSFLGANCGGDWETPVFFILYWDGAKIRGYVPTDGNPWNRTTKKAFGNDNKADLADAMIQFPHMEWDKEYYDQDIDHDWDKIEEDIKGRLTEG